MLDTFPEEVLESRVAAFAKLKKQYKELLCAGRKRPRRNPLPREDDDGVLLLGQDQAVVGVGGGPYWEVVDGRCVCGRGVFGVSGHPGSSPSDQF